MEKVKRIICQKDKINIFLELFLEDNSNKIFNLLNNIGISCDSVLLHNLDTGIFLADIYYSFKCDVLDKRIIFEGNLLSDDNQRIIKVINRGNIVYYSYKKGEIKKVDSKQNEVIIMENSEQLIMYEKHKIKRYVKKFFFNDDEIEKRINDILINLGIEVPMSIYFHSLERGENFSTKETGFSFICNCNEEKNSRLEFKLTNINNRVIEEIILKNDDGSKSYYYDCLSESLREKDKPKVKMKRLD